MNKVILIGRLTRDPEMKYTKSGIPVANFTLAVDRYKEDEADFIRIVTWRNLAENCTNYLKKGSQACVEGSLQIRSYEVDGQKRTIAEVVANNVKFLDTRKAESTGAEGKEVAYNPNDIPF